MTGISTPLLIALAGLAAGLSFLLISFILRKRTGVPEGRIVYADPGMWGRVDKPLYDSDLGLTGKPDYLVRKKGQIIPVEIKSTWAPRTPYDSHRLQLGAYCLLVEAYYGQHPAYGLLRYRNRTFKIPFSDEFREEVLDVLDEIRQFKGRQEVDRSHNHPGRCARCGFRDRCDQRL